MGNECVILFDSIKVCSNLLSAVTCSPFPYHWVTIEARHFSHEWKSWRTIVLQGISTYEKYEEDDNSSSDEWVDISHSSEDDADKNVDTHKDASDRREVDQKHRAMNQNENGDGDEVSPFMSL